MSNTRICFVIISFIFIMIMTSIAQTSGMAKKENSVGLRPHLFGHTFIPSLRVKDPFVQTSIRNSLGLGSTIDLDVPLLVIDGKEVLSLQGDVMFAILHLEYKYAVKNWLAAWVHFSILGRLGTEAQTLLINGIKTGFGFDLGWLFKLYSNDRMFLSGTIHLRDDSFTDVDLVGFLEDLLENETIIDGRGLVRSTPSFRVGAGIRYAYAFNEMFGGSLKSELDYGESIDRFSGTGWYTNIGVAFDMDLNPETAVPIGFALSYFQESYFKDDERVSSIPRTLSLRTEYTGRTDFSLGIDISYNWYRSERYKNGIQYLNYIFSMQYYF